MGLPFTQQAIAEKITDERESKQVNKKRGPIIRSTPIRAGSWRSRPFLVREIDVPPRERKAVTNSFDSRAWNNKNVCFEQRFRRQDVQQRGCERDYDQQDPPGYLSKYYPALGNSPQPGYGMRSFDQ